jgi:hypothetical protein
VSDRAQAEGKSPGEPRGTRIGEGPSNAQQLGRDLLKGAAAAAKKAETLSSERNVTAMEHGIAAVSRASGKLADRLASGASDKTARGIYSLQDKLSHAASQPAGDRIRNMATTKAFQRITGGLSALQGYTEARDRGAGRLGAAINAAAAAANRYSAGPIDIAINLASEATRRQSPKAAPFMQAIADGTPSKLLKAGVSSFIDTGTALAHGIAKGDWRRMANLADRQLQGKYGEVIRGYAMAGEALSAVLTRDRAALNRLSDSAAGGHVGRLAQFGDWIGDRIGAWRYRDKNRTPLQGTNQSP